ncbi:DNA-3-methyladenine glycosylase 2 family protein [Nesterenkonia natronophila]|uniref:DNA-3-methyladenine glycosylase II n=1 Tax=Nesterenkonia natronophila TaxID=2174932 RepID=A0A3A4F5L6_9MICC|nr:Ada metal-binding domain-containing protein [Nesterenkonia natronophila]RJN33051.1 DNA-3-methyladenine glycosylase 2 family protein [Nesterenkonia natronophila]
MDVQKNAAERYRAVQSRDRRFDGQFFTAVKTTGIYCRPSCPAVTPKSSNVEFFSTSAAAHEAGFRACKRCLPEASPGSPAWNLRQDLAGRAMRLIRMGALNDGDLDALSSQLGYSPRHIHRTLVAELGAGPAALARAHRAQVARNLLVSSHLRLADVAFSAGFGSVRQFNDTMRQIYAVTPTEIRTKADRSAWSVETDPSTLQLQLSLPVRQPFDAPGVFQFLAERILPGVEAAQLEDRRLRYSRTLWLPHGPGAVEVTATPDVNYEWQLSMRCEVTSLADVGIVLARVRRLFDLDADPNAVDAALSVDPVLRPLVAEVPGTRLVGTAEAEEYVIRAVVGQQISVKAARTHLSRLVERIGSPVESSFEGLSTLFPTPAQIIYSVPEPPLEGPLDPDRPLRLARRSIRTVRAASQALEEGTLRLHPGVHPDQLRTELVSLPGIGQWTAAYLALRVLGQPDDWMTGDVALIAGARRLGLLKSGLSPAAAHRQLERRAQQWSPWRSYAAMHLWRAAANGAPGPTDSA